MGRPVLGPGTHDAAQVILLVDVSASMAATMYPEMEDAVPQTRLDAARIIADQTIKRFGTTATATQFMVISIGARPRTVCALTSDQRLAEQAIHSLQTVDEVGVLATAIELIQPHLAQTNTPSQTHIVLISDGRFDDLEMPTLPADTRFEFIPVIKPSSHVDNVGIVTLAAHRNYEDPAEVDLLVRLQNCSPTAQAVAVRLEIDGQSRDIKTTNIPPPTPLNQSSPPSSSTTNVATDETIDTSQTETKIKTNIEPLPGIATLHFQFRSTTTSTIQVSHTHMDMLSADNTASLVLDAPHQSAVLVVSENGNAEPYLTEAIELLDLRAIRAQTIKDFNTLEPMSRRERMERLSMYELIIFDRVNPAFVPDIPTVSFGSIPPLAGVTRSVTEIDNPSRKILSWDRTHPVMINVGLDTTAVADLHRLTLPKDSSALVLAVGGPVVGVVSQDDIQHVLVAFDLIESNWPVQLGFIIFLRNVIDHLTLGGKDDAGLWSRPGKPTTCFTQPGSDEVRVVSNDGQIDRIIRVQPDGSVVIPPLHYVGNYNMINDAMTSSGNQTIAVSLLSQTESDLRPLSQLRLNLDQAANISGNNQSNSLPQDLWPWFILAAIVLLMFEWILFSTQSSQ